MTFEMNQVVWWEPIYFRWDRPALVEVVEVYRCGAARLSNGQTADADCIVAWNGGRVVGKVHPAFIDAPFLPSVWIGHQWSSMTKDPTKESGLC